MMAASSRIATLGADRFAPRARARLGLIGGAAIEQDPPTAEHADALLGLGEVLRRHFHRRTSGVATTGGWWILGEVDVEMADGEIVRPDLMGWRRDRVAERPRGSLIRARPDWSCDVLSNAKATSEVAAKLRAFERHEVPHYWLVDPERETLTAHRWTRHGYVLALHADRWQFVRVEPFDAVEIRVGSLFGEEP